jgi:hypothetical protein
MDKTPTESEITRAAQRYLSVLNYSKVRERRDNWKLAKERTLLPALQQAADTLTSVGVRAYVRPFEELQNFGTVQFWLGHEPTGIVSKTETESASGVQYGGALVFSQSENGKVLVLAYPTSTKLPKGTSEGRLPWLGPQFDDPLLISPEVVARLVVAFLEFAAASSIWWDGGAPSPEVLQYFRRPPELRDTHELLADVKLDTQRASELLTWGLPVLLDQVGEMFDHFEDEEVQRMLASATPRSVKAVARFVSIKSGGAMTEEEITQIMSGR